MNSQRGRGRGRGDRRPNQQNQLRPGNGLETAVRYENPMMPKPPFQEEIQRPAPIGRGRTPKNGKIPQREKSPETPVREHSDSSQSTPSPELPLCQRSVQLARRPGYGKAGRPVDLLTNYFQLKLSGTVYHYDIEINSLDQKKKYGKNFKSRHQTAAEAAQAGVSNLEHELNRGVGKLKRKEVFEKLVRCKSMGNYHPVFDGVKNMFTSKVLPIQDKQVFTVECEANARVRKYEVIIQPVKKKNGINQIQLDSLQDGTETEAEIIMALNSIMNHRETTSSQIQVGRSFFYLNQTGKINLGEGLEIWFGYHQSVHSTEKGAAVVINLAAKAFHKEGPVIDYINDVLRRDITRGEPLKHYELKNITDALKGVRVEVTHLSYPRRYIVEGISKLSAQDMKLGNDSKGMSIAQYFESKYRRLQFPYLHCLHMRSSNQQTYIPLEHCKVMKGQPKLGKLSPILGAKMIKQTAIQPKDRFNSIQKNSEVVKKESGDQLKNYDMFMYLDMLQVRGRVLNPPSLAYCERGTAIPNNRGVWNMQGNKFFKSVIGMNSWIILDFASCGKAVLDKFVNYFVAAGRKVGLNFGKLLDVKQCGRNVSSEQALRDAERTKVAFAVIILSRRDRFHSYDEIKFIADFQLQFVNQCVDEKVLGRFDDQIATNLCLKINVKLGGVNHVLGVRPKIFAKPVMIVGADAVHSPRGSRCPSIAAVVASMDATASKYKIACRVQENPDGNKISQELILEMRKMMTDLLKSFNHNTRGHHPEKIIFFRDGVSEGQFSTVYEYEISKIQEACQETIGCIVPITFIVVQKRHQTRFIPPNPRDGVGRAGNIAPGTAIDTDIVHPHRFDYFLNSHEGIQGTNKPAHYTILHDDNNFSADELQELCYHLCYTYNKCNRSISIPAPIKYADLACYRAKKYADFHLLKEQESSSSSSNSSAKLSDHARNAINTMGEQGLHFFFV